jgi:hypothetical protein
LTKNKHQIKKTFLKMGKKKRMLLNNEQEEETAEYNLPSKMLKTTHVRGNEKKLFIVLEGAQLETVKVSYQKALSYYIRLTS